MIISGGKVLANDKVSHDDTLSGTGLPWDPLKVNTLKLVHYEFVKILPITGTDNTVYIKEDENNEYSEWIYDNNTWKMVSNTGGSGGGSYIGDGTNVVISGNVISGKDWNLTVTGDGVLSLQ